MIIRSQDKKKLHNFDNIKFLEIKEHGGKSVIEIEGWIVGSYLTEEKAIKVLDMMQDEYSDFSIEMDGFRVKVVNMPKVFQVPPDSEV